MRATNIGALALAAVVACEAEIRDGAAGGGGAVTTAHGGWGGTGASVEGVGGATPSDVCVLNESNIDECTLQ